MRHVARRERNIQAVVVLAVAALHVTGVYMLARLDAAAWRRAVERDGEAPLDVEFVRVPARAFSASPAGGVASVAAGRRLRMPTKVRARAPTAGNARARPAVAPAEASRAAAGRLDLTLRHPTVPAGERDPDTWLQRVPALDPRTTRFDAAWVPAGSAPEQARFRSRAARVALGLFGGPPRRCSESERRLRMPACLPLHADELDAENLRRSVD
jgi:hypothetical protein